MLDFKLTMVKFSNSWNILVPIIFTVYYNPNYMDCIDGIKAYIYIVKVSSHFLNLEQPENFK